MRKLIYATLLSTTCLSSPAHAGPVVSLVSGFWAGLTTGVVAGPGIVSAWGTGAAIGAAIGAGAAALGGTFLGRLVMSVGLSALAQSMAPKPQSPPPMEVMANYAQPLSFIEMVYGEVRKGGPYALSEFSRKGKSSIGLTAKARRHYGVILAAHPIEGITSHYLDKWEVDTDADGVVDSHPVSGRCKIRVYDGTQTAPDPIWDAVFPEITASDYFPGLSYAALYANRPKDEDFSETYPSGREWAYAPVLRGENRIYDPRTGLTGWTNNAALVIADAAVRWYGHTVSWDDVAAQANICDQIVENGDGGVQKRWTINTVLRADMPWESVRSHMMMCCDAFFYELEDGGIGFKVGYFEEPDVTLTAADLYSVSLLHKDSGPDDTYSFAYKYVEPASDYSEQVTGAVIVGSNPAGGRAEEECYGITSHNQAWRCAYRWARASKPEWKISASVKYVGREILGQRFVRIQIAEIGLDEVFEISTLTRNSGTHTWALEAVSVKAEDFSPDAIALEPPRPERAKIAADGAVPPVGALSGSVVEGTGGVAQIEWTWPEQPEDLKQRVRIRQGAGDWQEVTLTSGKTSLLSTGLVDGATYEAQIRNVTASGRLSDWAPLAPIGIEAIADTSAPDAMQFFRVMQSGSDIAVSWTAPNSGNYAAARIYRATGSTLFADSLLIGTESGAANMTDEWLDESPDAGAHSYWIEPINGSGIAGPKAGPQTITIS